MKTITNKKYYVFLFWGLFSTESNTMHIFSEQYLKALWQEKYNQQIKKFESQKIEIYTQELSTALKNHIEECEKTGNSKILDKTISNRLGQISLYQWSLFYSALSKAFNKEEDRDILNFSFYAGNQFLKNHKKEIMECNSVYSKYYFKPQMMQNVINTLPPHRYEFNQLIGFESKLKEIKKAYAQRIALERNLKIHFRKEVLSEILTDFLQ